MPLVVVDKATKPLVVVLIVEPLIVLVVLTIASSSY